MLKVDRKWLVGGGIAGTIVLGAILLRRGRGAAPTKRYTTPADVAERERQRWEGLTEHEPAALAPLQEYWSSTGQGYPGSPDIPWSAAFVTHTVKQSSIPDALLPSGAHVIYARKAYLDRGVPGRYGAYRPTELRVQPNDIVLRSRPGGPGERLGQLTFSDLQRSGAIIPSHADVVTDVGAQEARAIGGNMGPFGYSSVKSRLIPHNGGVITDPAVVAVLRYQSGARFP
jgi:hypothetical protein